MNKNTYKINSIGLIIARGALWRLQNTFKAAISMTTNHYFFECMNMCRLILEQVSWCYSIYKLDEDEIIKTKTSRTITNFTDFIPESGKLYGFLSANAHISSYLTPQYIEVSKGQSRITLANSIDTLSCTFLLLVLLDYYGIVFEYIFKDYLDDLFYVYVNNDNNLLINPSRESKQMILKFRSRIKDIKIDIHNFNFV